MGKPQLRIGKHRFCERSINGTIVNWRCTRQPKGCRARVSTLDGMPKFTISRQGRPVMLLGSYRYNKWVGSKGRRVRWVCSQKTAGCKAKIYTFDDKPIFTTSNRGNPMIQIGGCNFSLTKNGGGLKRRWVCSKWGSTGCRATITTLDDVVLKKITYVTSRRGNTLIEYGGNRFSLKYLVYTVSKFGKPVILLGKYRYNVHNRSKGPRARWLCCRRTTGCRASVTTVDGSIVKIAHSHNH
ncbi:hypothetical protein RR46_03782 [Papilio xuthus]|uniref:FLYWCH-type domain-containing protein n=1 Tax=Papilio xuthus TaxID=66420 RepID=A0A194Q1F9_PAPXU|nr:hypothetical protein RR46_03782 [Papilio xuthus]